MSNDTRKATVVDLMAQIRAGLARLTLRRLRQGQTVEQLANKVSMSEEQWWGALNAEYEMTERTLAEMAFALDAEIDITLIPWEQEDVDAARDGSGSEQRERVATPSLDGEGKTK